MDVDEDLVYVTNSLRRIDVVYCLDSIDFAKIDELSVILSLPTTSVYYTLRSLHKHDIVNWKRIGNVNVYALTHKGKKIVGKLKEYHGIG